MAVTVGGGWCRQEEVAGVVEGVGTLSKTEQTGKAEEGGQCTAATAGRRRAWRWQRRLTVVWLGDSRGPAPVVGGGERRRKQKRGEFTGRQRRQERKKFGFITLFDFLYLLDFVFYFWLALSSLFLAL